MENNVNFLIKRNQDIYNKALVEQLNKAYADEWLAYYQYFVDYKFLDINSELSKKALEELKQHAADEFRHAELVFDRIRELGGMPLIHPKEIIKHSGCGFIEPKNFSMESLVEDSLKGEECAVEAYSKIKELTRGRDDKTFDLVSYILDEEEEHRDDLMEILAEVKGFRK